MLPTATFNVRPDCPSAGGFTLLELIIVLSVMVGLLAVVWPNLQRPLQRTSLDEAAQIVRDAIDESRYQASLRGVPYFVHLQAGSGRLRSGDFASLLEASTDTTSSLELDGIASDTASVRLWNLPSSVVVSDVDWTLESVMPSSVGGLEDFEESAAMASGQSPAAAESNNSRVAAMQGEPLSDSDSEFSAENGRQWWLPLTAEGRGRDAVIELLDASISQRLRVTYSAATGSLEISR